MRKVLRHVPDGQYSLNGFKVEVTDNNIYIQSEYKIHYGVIDSCEKKDNYWEIGYIRLGGIRKGAVKTKRGTGSLRPA